MSSFTGRIYVSVFPWLLVFSCARYTQHYLGILLSFFWQQLPSLTCHMFYCSLKHNVPHFSDIEFFIYFCRVACKLWWTIGCLGPYCDMISRGIKYIAGICFLPLSRQDDTTDKYLSSKIEAPQQQNKCVLCSIILIAPCSLAE